MSRFSFEGQPQLRLLTDEQIEEIYEEALIILKKTGVKVYSKEALGILEGKGAKVDFEKKIAKLSTDMVEDAIRKTPEELTLYDREGNESIVLGGNSVHFDPGSSPVKFMDSDGKVRESRSEDLVKISRLTDVLDNLSMQSTSVSLADVTKTMGDSYRLYILLKNSSKPIITGAFSIEGITHMKDMLAAVAGGEEKLREKPRAVFDVCPSPPLKWTEISARNIIDCARYGLPVEIISMPMLGAASPMTLAGSILVHTAETLSAIVLAQSIKEGSSVIYGGAPVNFDMRYGTASLSAVEATMIAASYSQIGKYIGLPTHTYAALSDSQAIDAQAGLETGISGIIAQLAGINVISGAGMLDFADCMSLEKLVIDNEICGISLRLNKGINFTAETLSVDLINDLGPGSDYLSTEHTMRWFKKEVYYPDRDIINRDDRDSWLMKGGRCLLDRAKKKVKKILEENPVNGLDNEREEELDKVTNDIMDELSIEHLPFGPK